MRLINAATRLFETFNDETKLPPYAILSHRWVDGHEVVYKDFLKGRNLDLSGRKKINKCCLQALEDGISYVWVDTCCIDKKSSAELSEAINSMYRWYGASTVCYAYLSDVYDKNWEQSFVKSTWFSRSWTLQEMLAPAALKFFDAEWKFIGEKSFLSEELAEASGIHLSVFTSERLELSNWSVAQRMSWASKREATRVEDIAYSLLGIFDVNMPLLYGEGKRAFRRLQEEIIRGSHDHTLFAWSTDHDDSWGLLASSPAAFEKDAHVSVHEFQSPKAYALTNTGLSIELPLELWLPRLYWAGLNATNNGIDQIGVWLLADETRKELYHRVVIPSEDFISRQDANSRCNVSRRVTLLNCQYTRATIRLSEDVRYHIPRLGAHHEGYNGRKKLQCWQSFASISFNRIEMFDFVAQYFILRSKESSRRYIGNWMFFDDAFRVIPGDNADFVHREIAVRYVNRSNPCNGILGDVVFPQTSLAIGILTIGLDREMRPIVLLAERAHIRLSESLPGISYWRSDAALDTSLITKHFWECHGLEEYGWHGPSPKPLVSFPDALEGLWALKATEEPVSSFLIHLNSFPDRYINIIVERPQKDRFAYVINVREGLRQPKDIV